MNPVQRYLGDVYDRRSTGATTDETSLYPPLEHLLNEIGKTLRPKVHAFMGLKEQGEGMPDGGLFVPSQLQQGATKPMAGQLPARGAIEAKAPKQNLDELIESDQVAGYLKRNGIVLVTNFREFAIVGRDKKGRAQPFERFTITPKETEFWEMARHSGRTAEQVGDRLIEFLQRAMLHAAPIDTPKDVAWFLASYAREAKARVEKGRLAALDNVRKALEQALGMAFEGEKGDHFFKSTLVQTLFYGVFSAWVLWCEEHRPTEKAKFDWREAGWTLHVPMISALFDQISAPTRLRSLNLVEVLNWTADTLNRVDRSAFFEKFDTGHAVQYFYEPFLEEFDPDLRKELGVWFTPPEIVKYMVARVDSALREILNVADGLADRRVVVLDPCCGTGAYLVEVLNVIGNRLKQRGGDALTGQEIKKAAMSRIYGFEILPAPFVVAHLQLGLLLKHWNAPLSHDTAERAGVFLTNSLTGWEPPKEPQKHLLFPELEEERDAANIVKQEAPILVVLGNPPYNAFAGVSPQEEQGLVEPYKKDLNKAEKDGGWNVKKFNLDDLYIRFFRLAERRIAEKSGRGIVCFISNFSFLAKDSFVVMRQRLVQGFDQIWLDNLNGDSRETGKLTPDGKPDPSVFSTEQNREGIRVGTAISLMVRRSDKPSSSTVRYREFWGIDKRSDLLESLPAKNFDGQYQTATPSRENKFSFRPIAISLTDSTWPKVTELSNIPPISGYMEKRGFSLTSIDRTTLASRMEHYLDPTNDWDSVQSTGFALTKNFARFDAKKARRHILAVEPYSETRIKRYLVRPLELRWCYYTAIRPIWNEPRPSLYQHHFQGNGYLVTRPAASASPEGVPFYFTTHLADHDFIRGHSYHFPISTLTKRSAPDLFGNGQDETPEPNISAKATRYLSSIGLTRSISASRTLWMHVLAVGFSPTYLSENKERLRGDWPQVPLPSSQSDLNRSASIGEQLAVLLDPECEVAGVTAGILRPEISSLALIKSLTPALNLEVSAGWGHQGKGGVTMPGAGKIFEREYAEVEIAAINKGCCDLGIAVDAGLECLGKTTINVHLNDSSYLSNVPINVWEYVIGGYQVIKKWLSYREKSILGRDITLDEATELKNIVRRISAILLLQPSMNNNYRAVKQSCFDWAAIREP